MAKKKLPKYCEACGDQLVEIELEGSYDPHTGKKVKKWYCSGTYRERARLDKAFKEYGRKRKEWWAVEPPMFVGRFLWRKRNPAYNAWLELRPQAPAFSDWRYLTGNHTGYDDLSWIT